MRSLFKFSCSGGLFVSITAPVKGVYPFGAIGRRNAAKTTSFAPDQGNGFKSFIWFIPKRLFKLFKTLNYC